MGEPLAIFGLFVFFAVIFGICVLWATHGHPSDADNEDLGVVAKDH